MRSIVLGVRNINFCLGNVNDFAAVFLLCFSDMLHCTIILCFREFHFCLWKLTGVLPCVSITELLGNKPPPKQWLKQVPLVNAHKYTCQLECSADPAAPTVVAGLTLSSVVSWWLSGD